MTIGDWLSHPQNWVFLIIAGTMVVAALRVVSTDNIVHAVLYLVAVMGGSAALFIILGAEFVAWTVVLVYIGAVIVLFLFGIMITRASLGQGEHLSHPFNTKALAAALSGALFGMLSWLMIEEFGAATFPDIPVTRTADLGGLIFSRYVIPFEVVSFVLLAALIGGIVLARRDPALDEPGGAML